MSEILFAENPPFEEDEREESCCSIVEAHREGAETAERAPLKGAIAVRAKDTMTGLADFLRRANEQLQTSGGSRMCERDLGN